MCNIYKKMKLFSRYISVRPGGPAKSQSQQNTHHFNLPYLGPLFITEISGIITEFSVRINNHIHINHEM